MKSAKSFLNTLINAFLVVAILSSIGQAQGEHEKKKEGEESGKRYSQNQTAEQLRSGVQLSIKFDKATSTFVGTVKNVSRETARRVRVEVHLSNKIELGPTKPVNLAPSKEIKISLPAKDQAFTWWTTHAEVGSSEHGDREEEEHSGRERGEHERKSEGEHSRRERGEHSSEREGKGGDGEESGIRYTKGQINTEIRKGVQLYLYYNKASDSFIGTVKNISNESSKVVKVEVHLSNKVELGPTELVSLAPGKTANIKLSAKGQSFTWWNAHAEVEGKK